MVANDGGKYSTSPLHGEGNISGLPPLYSHCVDDLRRMKVICIGAGFSGILAGIRFPQRVQNLDFVIYEKNADVGGTWFENKSELGLSHFSNAKR